jgi:hypothetical protein
MELESMYVGTVPITQTQLSFYSIRQDNKNKSQMGGFLYIFIYIGILQKLTTIPHVFLKVWQTC